MLFLSLIKKRQWIESPALWAGSISKIREEHKDKLNKKDPLKTPNQNAIIILMITKAAK